MRSGMRRVRDALRRNFVGKGVVYHGVVVPGGKNILVNNQGYIHLGTVVADGGTLPPAKNISIKD